MAKPEVAALEVERKLTHDADLSIESISLIDDYPQWIELYKLGRHTTVTDVRYYIVDKVTVKCFGNCKLKDI